VQNTVAYVTAQLRDASPTPHLLRLSATTTPPAATTPRCQRRIPPSHRASGRRRHRRQSAGLHLSRSPQPVRRGRILASHRQLQRPAGRPAQHAPHRLRRRLSSRPTTGPAPAPTTPQPPRPNSPGSPSSSNPSSPTRRSGSWPTFRRHRPLQQHQETLPGRVPQVRLRRPARPVHRLRPPHHLRPHHIDDLTLLPAPDSLQTIPITLKSVQSISPTTATYPPSPSPASTRHLHAALLHAHHRRLSPTAGGYTWPAADASLLAHLDQHSAAAH